MKDWILKIQTRAVGLFIRNCRLQDAILLLAKIDVGDKNVLKANNANINRSSIFIRGYDNEVILEGSLYKTKIRINGIGCKVIVSPKVVLNYTELVMNGNNCTFLIGEASTIGGAYIVCMGNDNYINIGKECMFAENIEIWSSDSHPVFNSDSIIINPSRPIIIGNHVWLGKHAKIMKGVVIGDNAVIGMDALVTKDIEPNSLNVGSPSKKIKGDINWDRNFIRC